MADEEARLLSVVVATMVARRQRRRLHYIRKYFGESIPLAIPLKTRSFLRFDVIVDMSDDHFTEIFRSSSHGSVV
jgi:hypothetical protein